MQVNTKRIPKKTAPKKQWYILKKKSESRWVAHEILPEVIDKIHPDYVVRGPYKSLLACLIVSTELET